jgi:uncharacterized protein (DUF697 family)
VCDADGTASPAEADFLARLRGALGLPAAETEPAAKEAEAIGGAPLDSAALLPAVATPPAAPALSPLEAEIDQTILRHAIFNGALELLPQSLAGMAVVPLQMKMVYGIGTRYGVTLDRGHVKEFLATIGAGLGSQVLEGYLRSLLGGLMKKTLGKRAARIGEAAVGPAMSFATTWAMGQVARSYYGGGRRLDTAALRQLFSTKIGEGRALFPRYEAEVRERARNVDAGELVRLVRGA